MTRDRGRIVWPMGGVVRCAPGHDRPKKCGEEGSRFDAPDWTREGWSLAVEEPGSGRRSTGSRPIHRGGRFLLMTMLERAGQAFHPLM